MAENEENIVMAKGSVRIGRKAKEWLDDLGYAEKKRLRLTKAPAIHELVDRAVDALKRELASGEVPVQPKSTIAKSEAEGIDSRESRLDFSEEEYRWVESLLVVLRSGNEDAVSAVTQNIKFFRWSVENARPSISEGKAGARATRPVQIRAAAGESGGNVRGPERKRTSPHADTTKRSTGDS
jgi:hypothetical protein